MPVKRLEILELQFVIYFEYAEESVKVLENYIGLLFKEEWLIAKGAIAKQNVTKKIQEIFGADFIGEIDKKIYVWTQENGERVQVAISLTCPKTPVSISDNPIPNFSGGLDFESMGAAVAAPTTFVPAEISEEEKQTVAELMARLGL